MSKRREGMREGAHAAQDGSHRNGDYGTRESYEPLPPSWTQLPPSQTPYFLQPYQYPAPHYPPMMPLYPTNPPFYRTEAPPYAFQPNVQPMRSPELDNSTRPQRDRPPRRVRRYVVPDSPRERSPDPEEIIIRRQDRGDDPSRESEEVVIRRADDQASDDSRDLALRFPFPDDLGDSRSVRSGTPTSVVNNKAAREPNAQQEVEYVAKIFGYALDRRIIERPTVIKLHHPIKLRHRKNPRRVPTIDNKHEKTSQPIFQVEKFLASTQQRRHLRQRRARWSELEDLGKEEIEMDIEADAGTILTVNSVHIIGAINRVIGDFPGLIRSGDSIILSEPFCSLLHHREELLNSGDQTPVAVDIQLDGDSNVTQDTNTSLEAAHLRKLFAFLDKDYLEPVQLEKMRWQQQRTCTYEWLWLLFAPQTLVYESRSHQSTMRAFQVSTFTLRGLFTYEGGIPTVNPARLEPQEHDRSPIESIDIFVNFLRHDGREWIRCESSIVISPFTGEMPITDLPIFPARFLEDPGGAVRQELIERGKRYQRLGKRGQVDYHGDTLSGVRRRVDGRVVVDSETYYYEPHLIKLQLKPISDRSVKRKMDTALRMATGAHGFDVSHDLNPHSTLMGGRVRGSLRSARATVGDPDSDDATSEYEGTLGIQSRHDALTNKELGLPDLDEEGYMICTPEILAYVLKEREWVKLAVASISDCLYDERMIDDLQITQEARNLVRALSNNFAMTTPSPQKSQVNGEGEGQKAKPWSTPWSADFIPGKGGGRIILLHGKPGVGKTSTAECIAELTKRPLLTITCGDLGTNAMSVDRELSRWLRLGTLWNAVLLFDEADVFLEARAHGDIDRNSLVSVFLRALEYYQGLMFLTTNRIGSFDEAIISRIHVVLHLPNLTNEDRERIWTTSFRKLDKERPDISVDRSLINYAYYDDEIRKLDWNGREIRNAFNTMIALAEWDAQQRGHSVKDGKVEVRREHLSEVARMSGTFKSYLKSLRQMEHEEYTKSLGLRDDRFRQGERR